MAKTQPPPRLRDPDLQVAAGEPVYQYLPVLLPILPA